jgi:hypothetical protein
MPPRSASGRRRTPTVVSDRPGRPGGSRHPAPRHRSGPGVGSGLGLHHLGRSTTARLGWAMVANALACLADPQVLKAVSPSRTRSSTRPPSPRQTAPCTWTASGAASTAGLVAALVEDLDRPLYHGGGHVGRCDFDSGDLTAGCFGSVPVDHPCRFVHIETDLVYFDAGRGYQILNDTCSASGLLKATGLRLVPPRVPTLARPSLQLAWRGGYGPGRSLAWAIGTRTSSKRISECPCCS